MNKKIAIMQPYIFPYIGYFQLINAVDTFVFYDDVNFIKKGWINRNRILLNKQDYLFTIPLNKASQNKLIKDIDIAIDQKWKEKFFTIIYHAYKNAPYYSEISKIIKDVFNKKHQTISDLSIFSIVKVLDYLALEFNYKKSSIAHHQIKKLGRAERLIRITKNEHSNIYINPIGGKDLYDKNHFKKKGIDLFFIETQEIKYKQFDNEFIPNLSIIDVLMFNSKDEIKRMCNKYKLI